MAQAFVQKIFHERRTNSTIQVPSEDSLIDEEQVKQIIETATKSFFEQEKQEKDVKETSVRCYLLACDSSSHHCQVSECSRTQSSRQCCHQ